jgi:hypothetical protein
MTPMNPIQYQVAATFLPQSDGTVVLVAPWPNALKRDDGSAAQKGDVLSVQPDGSLQTRPAPAIGAWEKATREGVALLYAGTGTTFLLLPVQG